MQYYYGYTIECVLYRYLGYRYFIYERYNEPRYGNRLKSRPLNPTRAFFSEEEAVTYAMNYFRHLRITSLWWFLGRLSANQTTVDPIQPRILANKRVKNEWGILLYKLHTKRGV